MPAGCAWNAILLHRKSSIHICFHNQQISVLPHASRKLALLPWKRFCKKSYCGSFWKEFFRWSIRGSCGCARGSYAEGFVEVRFCIQQFNQEFLSLLDFVISPNIFERFVSSFGFSPQDLVFAIPRGPDTREGAHLIWEIADTDSFQDDQSLVILPSTEDFFLPSTFGLESVWSRMSRRTQKPFWCPVFSCQPRRPHQRRESLLSRKGTADKTVNGKASLVMTPATCKLWRRKAWTLRIGKTVIGKTTIGMTTIGMPVIGKPLRRRTLALQVLRAVSCKRIVGLLLEGRGGQEAVRERRCTTCPPWRRALVWICMLPIRKLRWEISWSGTLEKKSIETTATMSSKRMKQAFEPSCMCLFGVVMFSRGSNVIVRKKQNAQQLSAFCENLR